MSGDITLSKLVPSSRALLDYWLKIRGSETVPARASVRPGDIAPLLPSLMLFEYRAPDALMFRLAGTEVTDRMGIEFTGMNLFEFVLPEQLADSHHWYNTMRTRPCGLVLYKQLLSKYNTGFLSEQIYLPLYDREGEITQIVGMCNVLERHNPGHAPAGLQSMRVLDARFIDVGAGVPEQLSALKVAG